jgi:hypothetical protein
MTLIDIFTHGINTSALIALIIKIISIFIIAFFILPIQISDIARNIKDGLQNLRWMILGFLTLYLLFSITPSLYQYYRVIGQDYGVLRDVSGISSNLATLAITIWLVLVYTYKKKTDI